MFERFTERARQVVVLAQDEARALKHGSIGTEHILLGLLREEEGVAARALASLGVALDDVRAQIARVVGEGDEVAAGEIPFTPRTKKVLELALREALARGQNFIGTEHILLGIARVDEGVAARILAELGAPSEKIRNELTGQMGGPFVPPGRFAIKRRRRWEYRVESLQGDEPTAEKLNELGAEGWELAATVADRLIFKRRRA